MKNFLFAALLLCGLATTSLKADSFYVGAFGGGVWIQDDLDYFDLDYHPGYTYGGSAGYQWSCSGWRVEGEFAYTRNRIKRFEFGPIEFRVHGRQSYYQGMGNIIYDFCIPTSYCHPFVGVGGGWYQQRIELENGGFVKEDDIAWQLLAGLSYEVNCCYSIELTYVLFKPRQEFYLHNARLGCNYHF